MLKLLIHTLAKEFYRQHAGIFLIGFYLLFGIVNSSALFSYHIALLSAAISSPAGIAITLFSWVLYALKVYFFIKQKLSLSEYNFIRELGSLDKKTQLKLWVSLYSILLMPIIIYVCALIGLSLFYHYLIALSCILAGSIVLVFSLSYHSYQSVTFGFLKPAATSTFSGFKINRPFLSWPLYHLLQEQTLMLFMCKVLSLLFFRAVVWMFADAGNDTRVFLIALLASVLCHAVLIYTLLKFETAYLSFSKSLPVSAYKRLLSWIVIFGIILLPEWALLITSSRYSLPAVLNGFLFSLAGLLFLFTALYRVKLNMDIYFRWLLLFFFISMLLITAQYYVLFSVILLLCCSISYLSRFYKAGLKTTEE